MNFIIKQIPLTQKSIFKFPNKDKFKDAYVLLFLAFDVISQLPKLSCKNFLSMVFAEILVYHFPCRKYM